MRQHVNAAVDAANRIEQAIQNLAAARRDLQDSIDAVRKEAFNTAGKTAVEDLMGIASPDRIADEIAGALRAEGLGDVARNATAVHDFAASWGVRLARVPHASRRIPDPRNTHRVPGQLAVGTGRSIPATSSVPAEKSSNEVVL